MRFEKPSHFTMQVLSYADLAPKPNAERPNKHTTFTEMSLIDGFVVKARRGRVLRVKMVRLN